jgi:hypothetical protein
MKTNLGTAFAVIASLTFATATAIPVGCGGDAGLTPSPSQGSEGGSCYPNGTCNTGLACASNACVIATDSSTSTDGDLAETGNPDASDTGVDAPTSDGPRDGAVEANADAALDGQADAPSDGPTVRCDIAKPFGAPVLVAGLTNTTAMSVSLSPDELTIYVTNSLAPQIISVATRATRSAPFGSLASVGNINTAISGNDTHDPSITADGLTLYFVSQPPGQNWSWIYFSTRANTAAPFDALSPGLVNVNADMQHARFAPNIGDGTTLYFNRDGFVYASQGCTGACTPPVPVTDLGGAQNAVNAVSSTNGLTLYFASNRVTSTAYNVFRVTRAHTSDVFGNVAIVTELNSNSSDYPNWLSPDECAIYTVSGRNGSFRAFVATRPM